MRVTAWPVIKVTVFVTVMGLLVALIGLVFGRVRLQPSNTYSALFSDASGLVSGDDVRGDGVTIGSVSGLSLAPQGGVLVTFSVERDVPLTTTTAARIRYANLTGERYLDLTPGASSGSPLTPGASIPESRTTPALDLDQFFQGFDPLMQALDPDQINELASNILQVTQGQASAVQTMLANVGAFTSHLADRDQIIGETIASLSQALTTMANQRGDFDQLIVQANKLLNGLAQDRKVIGASLNGINNVAADAADLLRRARPGIKANIDNLGTFSKAVNANAASIEKTLNIYPTVLGELSRLGAYGSFFNFYLCGVRVKIDLPGQALDVYTPWVIDNTHRCGGK